MSARAASTASKCGYQQRAVDRLALQAQALLEAHEVGRREHGRAVAGVPEDRLQHRAGRALAVGTGNRDDRAIEGQPEALCHGAGALQAEFDGLGMLSLGVREPVG
jgi:hypothetical protein